MYFRNHSFQQLGLTIKYHTKSSYSNFHGFRAINSQTEAAKFKTMTTMEKFRIKCDRKFRISIDFLTTE